jgi:hypothetical protein
MWSSQSFLQRSWYATADVFPDGSAEAAVAQQKTRTAARGRLILNIS